MQERQSLRDKLAEAEMERSFSLKRTTYLWKVLSCVSTDDSAPLEELARRAISQLKRAEHRSERYRQALELIAAPKRPDGTYNNCREACELIAKKALETVPWP